MTRYLVTGAGGMLGVDLVASLDERAVTALPRHELDITNLSAVRRAVAGHDIVINAAAYTRVDEAESDEDAAYAVNATGAQNLALAAAENGATLLQISTDYVFDGCAREPYPEDAVLSPKSAYGRTKAAGEQLALAANPDRTLIVRTAWLYGKNGNNFARTMLRLAGEREQLSVVTDQLGQPTWTADVAAQVVTLLDSGVAGGIFHATSSGEATWFDFAREIFAARGLDPERIRPSTSAEFPRPAVRPAYSVLGHDAWKRGGLPAPRPWREALAAAVRAGALD